MITKLVEATVLAFPMWPVLLITAVLPIMTFSISFYDLKCGGSVDRVLTLQLWWLALAPIFLMPTTAEVFGHIESGIMLGVILSFCLYVFIEGCKKLRQVF